jgi:excisionase family DNA binding protein
VARAYRPKLQGSATLERFDVVRGTAVALSQVTGRKRAMTAPSQASRRQYESVGDAAARVGVSTKTVRRWIASGQLAGYRVGPRLLRVDPDDLDRMLRLIPAARAI